MPIPYATRQIPQGKGRGSTPGHSNRGTLSPPRGKRPTYIMPIAKVSGLITNTHATNSFPPTRTRGVEPKAPYRQQTPRASHQPLPAPGFQRDIYPRNMVITSQRTSRGTTTTTTGQPQCTNPDTFLSQLLTQQCSSTEEAQSPNRTGWRVCTDMPPQANAAGPRSPATPRQTLPLHGKRMIIKTPPLRPRKHTTPRTPPGLLITTQDSSGTSTNRTNNTFQTQVYTTGDNGHHTQLPHAHLRRNVHLAIHTQQEPAPSQDHTQNTPVMGTTNARGLCEHAEVL